MVAVNVEALVRKCVWALACFAALALAGTSQASAGSPGSAGFSLTSSQLWRAATVVLQPALTSQEGPPGDSTCDDDSDNDGDGDTDCRDDDCQELNPALASCGLDVVLVLDSSDSLDNSEIQDVKDAAHAFVDALAGTPSRVGVVDFDTTVIAALDLTNVMGSQATIDAAIDAIGHTFATEYTNWEAGLNEARLILTNGGGYGNDRDDFVYPDLIIMITDGDPTTSDSVGGIDIGQPNAHLCPAVEVANLAKTATNPIRIVAVGVGSAPTIDPNLISISGPMVVEIPPDSAGDIDADTDVIVTNNFSDLDAAVESIAIAQCECKVTVCKVIDTDNDCGTTGDQTPGVGWHFEADGFSGDTDETGCVAIDVDGMCGISVVSVDVVESLVSGSQLLDAHCTGSASNNGTFDNTDSVDGVEVNPADIITCTFCNKTQSCGNGIVEGTEECDPGADVPGDCCTANCLYETSGTACDDGDACNAGEVCNAGGLCQGGAPVTCPDNGDPCTDLACDPGGSEGNCAATVNVNENGPCDDGNACNTGETCVSGVCQGGSPVTCPDNGDFCTDAACDPGGSEGNCAAVVNVNESSPCDDGLFCTIGETCTAGVCGGGSPRDCSLEEPADCLEGVCDENADACVSQPANDFGPCDDGQACNVGESCLNGVCQGGAPVTCPDNGDPCTDLACDPDGFEGNCAAVVNVNENGPCDDGLFCTIGETCTGGVCGGGFPRDCSLEEPADCLEGVCDENADSCVTQPANYFGPCDDGQACNVGESCLNGVCQGGAPVTCPDNGDPCTDLACDPDGFEGNCASVVNVNENGPCDDGLFCTIGETCVAGVCQGGTPRDCSLEEPADCLEGVCDENADSCVTQPANDFGPCDDGLACSVGESCLGGVCQGGTPVTCPDNGDPCTDLACDPGGFEGNCASVVNVNENGPCDDGNACNTGETCVAGLCQGGASVTCPDNGDPCTDLACDPGGSEGNCDATINVNENGPCDDGNSCNTGETCVAGICQGGSPVTCPDNGDPCTDLACDPFSVIEGNCAATITVNETGPCDDGNACNTGETCVAGSCQGGSPVSCPDNGDPCSDLACDPGGSEGNCAATINVNENGPCDDGNACNTGETCVAGSCTGGAAVTCPDNGDPCTDSACDPGGSEGNCAATVNVNENGPCDDGNACNTGETCVTGSCTGGTPVTCPDNGDFCTDAVCSPGGAEGNCDGVINVNENAPCNDNDACNVGESCQAGFCQGGSAVTCPDNGDPCSSVVCNPGGAEGNCDGLDSIPGCCILQTDCPPDPNVCTDSRCNLTTHQCELVERDPCCGDGVREGTEECDGNDDDACPGMCNNGCSCSQGVPAASDWSMLILTLVLAAGLAAKCGFCYRKPVAQV